MKGSIEQIEPPKPQLELCQHLPEPLHLVWSLTLLISRSEEIGTYFPWRQPAQFLRL
jgi:hypothetical protein